MLPLEWTQPLQRLKLNRLLTFAAIAELRSFRGAAARLHLSQSALSAQIRELESELGLSLLHRTTRSVTPTREGQRLLVAVRRIGSDLAEVMAELRGEAALQRGVVSIAVLPSLAATLVPDIMRAFSARHPGVTLSLRDADSARVIEMIRNGEVDIGILSMSESWEGMRFQPLLDDDLLVLVPASARLWANRRRARLRELAEHPLLLNPRGVDLREILEQLFRAEAIVPKPVQELVTTQGLVSLVRTGQGITVLPRLSLRGLSLSGCRILGLTPAAHRRIGMVSVNRRSESPALTAFREFAHHHVTGSSNPSR